MSESKYADIIAVRGDVLRHINLLQNVDLINQDEKQPTQNKRRSFTQILDVTADYPGEKKNTRKLERNPRVLFFMRVIVSL